MRTTTPIFIHSLFRSASTYFFQKFRSLGPDYTCFQEPLNESLTALNHPSRHARLLQSPHGSPLRHPPLDRPYFYEFWTHRQQLRGLFREQFAYRQYFPDSSGRLPAAQSRYLQALLASAQGRPVLQFCRSSGRTAALRREFGGLHIHLWREPRVQWWSYKVADYFDSVSQRIFQAEHLPESLARVRSLVGSLQAGGHVLRPRDNYLLFYGIWLDSWLRLQSHADLSINVDAIGASSALNASCARQLSALVERALDLSDVRASGMVFTPEEQSFYADSEQAVHAIFVQTRRGTSHSVEAGNDAARAARALHERLGHDAAAERNVRVAALAMMERLAERQSHRLTWPGRLHPRRLLELWQALQAPPPEPRGEPVSAQSRLNLPASDG